MAEMRAFECADCGHVWEVPFGTGRPEGCPSCQEQGLSSGKGGRGRIVRRPRALPPTSARRSGRPVAVGIVARAARPADSEARRPTSEDRSSFRGRRFHFPSLRPQPVLPGLRGRGQARSSASSVRDNTFTAHARGECQEGVEHNHHHGHGAIVEALKDCEAVLCYGMGWRAAEDLKQNGIQAFIVPERDVARRGREQVSDGRSGGAGGFCRCQH